MLGSQSVFTTQEFFTKFDAVKIGKIADMAGLNQGLVRQFAAGVRQPSPDQAKIIEASVHQLAQQLSEVQLT